MNFRIIAILTLSILITCNSVSAQRISYQDPISIAQAAVPKSKKTPKKNIEEENQEDQFSLQGFILYINAGVLFANKYNAKFYNGNPANLNNIDWVVNSQVYQDDIRNALGISSYDTFYVADYAYNMRYEPAFNVGLGIRYGFGKHWAAFIQFSQSSLKTVGTFQMYREKAIPSSYIPDYYTGSIVGTESRSIIDLGATFTYPLHKYMHLLVEGGFNFNNTKVKRNDIYIEGLTYSIINPYGGRTYTPGMVGYDEPQNYNGYGGFLSTGLEFNFSKSAAFDLVYSLYCSKTGMEGYTGFATHHQIALRFLINRLSF